MPARKRPVPNKMTVTLHHQAGVWLATAACMGTTGQATSGRQSSKLVRRAIDQWWDAADAACRAGAPLKGRLT